VNKESCSPWKVGKLEDVLELNESGVWGESGTQTDFPVLRSTNIQNGKLILDDVALRKVKNPEKFVLKDGDILITKSSGSPNLIGKCGIFHHPNDSKEYLFSNFVQRIRVNKLMLPEFLYYFLNSDWGKRNLSRLHETTSGLRNLDMSRYVKQEIPIPEIETQRIITSILRKIHDVKQKREHANQMTNRILQAVFLKMFGNPITNTKGWKTDVIDNYTSVKSTKGSTPTTYGYKWETEGILFLRSECITNEGISLNGSMHISKDAHDFMHRSKIYGGDILIRITGEVGISTIFPTELGEANINQHIAIIRLKENCGIEPIFLVSQLNVKPFRDYYFSITRGVTHPHLSLQQIRETKIIVPPIELQKKFVSIANRTESMQAKQNQSAKETNELFNSLMSKAFKGELVRDVLDGDNPQQTLKESSTLDNYLES